MGNLQAMEMASLANQDAGLRWHLQSNHFPPVPLDMLQPCKDAIEAADDGDWDREITLPISVEWRGHATAPAWAVIEGHHLDAWLGRDDLEDAYDDDDYP